MKVASAGEMVNIGMATTCATVIREVLCYTIDNNMPRSYYLLYWFFLNEKS